jgi:hypothetical protein
LALFWPIIGPVSMLKRFRTLTGMMFTKDMPRPVARLKGMILSISEQTS